MQEESNSLTRRNFLRLTGTSAAIAGTAALLPRFALADQATPLTDRSKPARSVTLRSAALEVVLDAKDGLPWEYRLGGNRLRGEDFGQQIAARICRKSPWSTFDLPVAAATRSVHESSAEFHFTAIAGGANTVSFTLRYTLQHSTLVITLEDVKEEPGYELISVEMPRLVTVREQDGPAWLVHGDGGGSLTMLHEATAGALPPNRFWGNVLGTLPVVMVGTGRMLCVQETTAFMDGTELTVAGTPGSRRASIGTSKTWRVDGSACYDLNLEKGEPRNCGTAKTPNLLIEQPSSCRLDFLPVQGAPEDAWIDGAKLVRSRMPEIPTHYYDDKYVYGIRCDEPHFPAPAATFAECESNISAASELIDRSPQVVHLWGWQFHGKDTGYPAVNEVNQRLGGYDAMMHLMQRGKDFNATVTLSDNYDDAYRSSPAWNDAIIARRPDGELWKSHIWTGEASYIMGLAKYMAGPGPERVRYTCERYKLPETTHVDVLSYYSIRNDWDPQHPASGIRNLIEGRYRVLQEFKSHGVDVSSEALRYPMIGHISCFWYLTGPEKCPFGGQPVPMVPLIYRNSAVWGLSGGHQPDETVTRLNELFLGASPRAVGLSAMQPAQVTDLFYLWMVPWFQTHLRNIEAFHRDNSKTTLSLERNSFIAIDWEQKTHTITLDGEEVARTGQLTCPLGKDRIAFYATTARQLSARLPEGWNTAEIGAVTISADSPGRRTSCPFAIGNGRIELAVAPAQPVIVYRNKADLRLS
jgi:hypothetical protein